MGRYQGWASWRDEDARQQESEQAATRGNGPELDQHGCAGRGEAGLATGRTAQRSNCVFCGMLYGHLSECPLNRP